MRRPSAATVIATVVLFAALGGTSIAATTLARNSVGTAQLKKNAVTSAKVKNGTLSLKDFSPTAKAGLQGAPGATGPKGDTGPQGSQGPAGPSASYQSYMDGQVTVVPSTTMMLMSLELAPGAYLVQGKLNAEAVSNSTKYLNCWIGVGSGIDQSIITLSGVDEEWQTCTNMSLLEVTTTSTLWMWVYAEAATTHVKGGKLIATRVGSVEKHLIVPV